MTDQQNGWTIRENQNLRAKTPNLDRFRQQAVSFTHAFSPSPHCCPSRASFFSSSYPSEHGVWNNVNVTNALARGPRQGTQFWSSEFSSSGYQLAFSGKWHVSNHETPRDFGWYELFTTATGESRQAKPESQQQEARIRELNVLKLGAGVPQSERLPGEIIRPGWPRYIHYGTDENPFDDAIATDAASAYIRAAQPGDTPWCLYTGTLGPHDPYTPPRRFLDWYSLDDMILPDSFRDTLEDKPGLYSRTRIPFDQLSVTEHRDALRHYLAFCSYEDELFGQLLSAVEQSDQLENTLVLYLSDHGDYAAEHGLWGKGLPAFLSAYRIPCVIGGAGISPSRHGTECDIPLSLVDIGPTLLDLCEIDSTTEYSGKSFQPWLSGQQDCYTDADLFFQSNGNEAYGIQRAIVSGTWKLVYNMFDHDELYDLHNDPDELNNLLHTGIATRRVGQPPLSSMPQHLQEVVKQLYSKLWTFALAHNDENINDYILTALAPFGPGIVLGCD